MTESTETSLPAPRAPRAARRGPADLPFTFVDLALVTAISDDHDEPAAMREDRLAALARFEALPVEASRLYTPYVDLRAACWSWTARRSPRPRSRPRPPPQASA